MDDTRDIWWEGSSLDDLRAFPNDVKHAMGYQLHRLQSGSMPDDWKPMSGLGEGIAGVYEIRVSTDGDAYRTAYVAKFGGTIAVLHCWQKKSQKTARPDLQTIAERYRAAKEKLK